MKPIERAMRMFKILGTLRDELFYFINTKNKATVYKIIELVQLLKQEASSLKRDVELEGDEIYASQE